MVQEPQTNLLYGVEARPPILRTWIYAFQWIGFTLANTIVVPVIVGPILGLDIHGTTELVQTVVFFIGLGSLLQGIVGHRYPIVEGVAGMWWGVTISLAATAASIGKPSAVLRSDLQTGLIIAGVILFILGITKTLSKLVSFFTPAVTGSAMVLLSIQMSGTFIPGMLGVTESSGPQGIAVLVSTGALVVVALVSLFGPRAWRSYGILAGLVVGWIAYELLGGGHDQLQALAAHAPDAVAVPGAVRVLGFSWPFPWGSPTFDFGVTAVCVLTALILTANQIVAIQVTDEAVGDTSPANRYNRSLTVTGIANILTGSGGALGLNPFASSVGVLNLSGVAARIPFVLHAILLMGLGLIPSLAVFATKIPGPVGHAVLMAAVCQLLVIGLRSYTSMKLDPRDSFVLGPAILGGTGIMLLPAEAIAGLPTALQYILGNGMITGMLIAVLAEKLVPRPNEGR